MERSGYALARQVNLSLPVDELDKVLAARSAPAALLYLALQRTGGKLPRAEELSLSGADYQTAVEVLRGAGVLKTAEQPVPDLHTLPEYTAEDLVTRVNEDRGFSDVVHWAEQLYGRKLTSPEMKKLLGMQDHLGLPPAVLMQMLTYAFDAYREQHPTRRSPGIRYLEAEAIRWADDEVLTLDLAEQYIARNRARSSQAGKIRRVLHLDHEPSKTEREYIDSWIDLGLPPELIEEAYDRTVTNTGRMTWAYLNKILLRWHEQNIRTLAAVLERDPRGAQRRRAAEPAAAQPRNDLARAQELLRGMREQKED
ncbi:MAG: DnaD domain protein [Oscillospiraceae bacterium]|nr:DnaD domain protein [Oscillospiraceae bacterium]